MNLLRGAVLIFAVAIVASHAAETNLTVDGITYTNVIFGKVTASSVYIHHTSGITRLPLAKLPMELQERFGYDPERVVPEKEHQEDKPLASIPRSANDTWLAAIKADPQNYIGKVVTIVGCVTIGDTYEGAYSDSASEFYSLKFQELTPSNAFTGEQMTLYLSKKAGKPLVEYLASRSGGCIVVKIMATRLKRELYVGPQAEVVRWCRVFADGQGWKPWEPESATPYCCRKINRGTDEVF